MKKALLLTLIIAVFAACFTLTGCSREKTDEGVLQVGTIAGPTGMGMAKMMDDGDESYSFEIFNSPDTIRAAFISGSLDVAAVPITLAAALLSNTNDSFCRIAAVNTLGVLYIVENGDSVQSIQDLAGKDIYTISQGSTTEYILNYLIAKNELKDVNVIYKTEAAEVITLMAQGKISVAMLPEPNVTVLKSKVSGVRTALDVTAEWDKVSEQSAVQGCIIVSKNAVENKKHLLDSFMDDYKKSVDFVNSSQDEAAEMMAAQGLLPSKEIALQAIPRSNIVFTEGDEMVRIVNSFMEEISTVANGHSDWSKFGEYAEEKGYYYTR